MSARRGLALALTVAALVGAGSAGADGDPASDILYSSWVFLPFTTKIPSGYQTALNQTVLAARKAGYPIKVALIEQRYDLGAIPELYRKPQAYARFLGLELAFIYHGPLLIVMPNGFGFYDNERPVARQLAVLQQVRLANGAGGLAGPAIEAVRRLAAAAGKRLPPPAAIPGAKRSTGQDRLVIVLGAVGFALVIGAAWLWRVRRRARSSG